MINPIYYSEFKYNNYDNNNNTSKSKKLIDLSNENNYLKPKKELVTDGIIYPDEETNITNINTDLDSESNKNLDSEVKNDIIICTNNIMKQNILNPLSVIIKLSILSCKPIGTKIHIQDNIIYFQEPGIFQSLARYIFNSNKSHLQYLYNPIKIACQKYLSKEFIKKMPRIVNIFNSAKNGIENLIKTYSTCSITVLCLKYYHVIITNFINETSNEYLFTESTFNELDTKDFYTKELLEKFENQWNTSKLKMVLILMDFLLIHDVNKNKTTNIKSLETIITNTDEETYNITTEYYKNIDLKKP
jgi:hypothetical protein